MSHEIKAQIEVTDLKAFEAAITELGGTFHRGQKTYRMYQGRIGCDHAASFPGINYEVGLKANPQKPNVFDPVWDTFGSNGQHDGQRLLSKLGPNMGRLKQAYGLQVAERAARSKGHTTRRKLKANGTVQLIIGG